MKSRFISFVGARRAIGLEWAATMGAGGLLGSLHEN
jgi:hypothetical protein